MEEEKVYCKDCKYYYSQSHRNVSGDCMSNIKKFSTYLSPNNYNYGNPNVKNRRNDCLEFEGKLRYKLFQKLKKILRGK